MNAARFKQFENPERATDGLWLCDSEVGSIVKNHFFRSAPMASERMIISVNGLIGEAVNPHSS